MRRLPLLAVLIAAATLLTGCANLHWDVTINEDETVDVAVSAVLTGRLGQTPLLDLLPALESGESPMLAALGPVSEKVTRETITTPDGKGLRWTFTGLTFDEAARLSGGDVADHDGGGRAGSVSLARFDDKYHFTAPTPLQSPLAALVTGVAASVGSSKHGTDPEDEQPVKVFYSLTVPGAVLETNGAVQGRTVTWNMTGWKATDTATALARSHAPWFTMGRVIAVVSVVLLVVLVVFWLLLKRFFTTPDPEPDEPAEPPQAPGAAEWAEPAPDASSTKAGLV